MISDISGDIRRIGYTAASIASYINDEMANIIFL